MQNGQLGQQLGGPREADGNVVEELAIGATEVLDSR